MSTTNAYQVIGMTCDHCVHAVTSELMRLDSVTDVSVGPHHDAVSIVTVTSDDPLTDEVVAAAIDEAGYELAAP